MIWNLNIPLKIGCFIWLLDRGRILTWDQLQLRGFQGPSRCVLCGLNSEDIQHLFLECSFSMGIHSYYATRFGFSSPLFKSVSSFLVYWFNHTTFSAHYRYFPLFIFWCIWKLRNRCLFDNGKPIVHALISRIESLLNLYPVPQKKHKLENISLSPLKVFPCGFFDGAAAENIGGVGFVIFLNDVHFFRFSMGCGCSSITRAELLALWAILRVSMLMGLPIHTIFGDSLVIISWLNRLASLNVPSLIHWCDDIRNMLQHVPHVIFKHIFREHNSLADGLSK